MKSVYHHGDLKNALLDAADALWLREGLQGFTMRACARLANVSHAAPAHHFGDTQLSELHIIDAQDFEAKPLGIVKLNARVPFGFHGNFLAG